MSFHQQISLRNVVALSIGTAVIVAGTFFSSGIRQPSSDRWKPASTSSSRIGSLLGGQALAEFCLEPGLVREEFFASSYPQLNPNNTCGYPGQGWAEGQGSVKTYCDGEVVITQPTSGGFCNFPDGITCNGNTFFWVNDCNSGSGCENSCMLAPPQLQATVECERLCPPQPPCCKGNDCSDCVIQPLSLPGAELSYSLPVFNTNGAGFPRQFEILWRGRSIARLSPTGPVLGPRAAHSLAFYFYKGVDAAEDSYAHVASENGDVAAFKWEAGTSTWKPQDGRRSSLVANPPGQCAGIAVFTEDDGTVLRFNDYCVGASITEGTIITQAQGHGLTRPNGDFVDFGVNAYGQLSSATNRLGETIAFGYDAADHPGTESWGRIWSITSSSGDVFKFRFAGGVLGSIVRDTGAFESLWTLETDPTSPTDPTPRNAALTEVRDAKGYLEHRWTYDGSSGIVLASEAGPGETIGDNSITIEGTAGTISLTFTPAGGTQPVTNAYTVTAMNGALSHVTSRSLAGDCPNCGGADEERRFWVDPSTGLDTNLVRAASDGNGYITVYENLLNGGSLAAAYSDEGSPLAVNEGCTGSLSSPTCTSARRFTYSYLAGTRVVSGSTSPSIAGGGAVVTKSRTFHGTTSRVEMDSTTGSTAATLDGVPDNEIIRSTKTSYGVGAGGLEVSRFDGPYEGAGSPPSDAPRTDYDWYADNSDACGGSANQNNLNRLKTVTRFVDSTRSLMTKYCNYDSGGRAQKTIAPNGTVTTYTFNWRGQVLQQVENSGGLALTTDFTYDLNGNLTEIRKPRTNGSNRVGVSFVLDDADRVTDIKQGYFTGSTFTPVSSVHYSFDPWGNRIGAEYRNGAGGAEVTESATYDAFNRLSEIARPAGSSTKKTTFGYDARGNLTRVGDSQGDDVRYGTIPSSTFVEEYDRFSKMTHVQQEICSHDSNPNGTCSPSNSLVQYTYDLALNLSEVRIKDARVAGSDIVTSYGVDDFGSVVRINSPDDGGDTWYRYDGAGRLYESQDQRQRNSSFHIRYFYDRMGRLTGKKKIAGSEVWLVRFCYDGYNAFCGGSDSATDAGYLTAVNDNSVLWTYDRDAAGRLLSEDRGGIITSFTYDKSGNALLTKQPNGLYIKQIFDDADRLEEVRWAPDSIHSGTPIVDLIEWSSGGDLKTFFFYSGTRTFSVNQSQFTAGEFLQSGLIEKITLSEVLSPFNQILQEIFYTYANDGSVTSFKRFGTGTYSGNPGDIRHDSLGRISQDLQAGSGGNWGTATYSYDAAGNRSAHNAGTYTFASNTTDQVTNAESRHFRFDPAGNVDCRSTGSNCTGTTTAVAYDELNRATSVATASGTTTYARDYRNLRISKAGAGGSGSYYYDPAGNMIQWTGPMSTNSCSLPRGQVGNTRTIPYENYVYLGGKRVAMIKSHISSACVLFGTGTWSSLIVDNNYYYFSDKMDMPRVIYRVGSPSTFTRVWDANFDSFGNPIGTINENPSAVGTFSNSFRLPGQFALSLAEGGPTTTSPGIHENWNRLYDSAIGRYLQPDPIKKDPMSYGYVANSPLNWTDPTGEDIKIDYSQSAATIMIDTWDSGCCKNLGSLKFRYRTRPQATTPQPPWWWPFSPNPVGQVQHIYPVPVVGGFPGSNPYFPPLPRDGSPGSYCTTCQQDTAAAKAAIALVGVAQQPYDRARAQALFDLILISAGITPGGPQTPCESSQRPR